MIKNVAYYEYGHMFDTIARRKLWRRGRMRRDVLFAPMNSPHEAMAVILEEYTEYQLEVFKHNTIKARPRHAATAARRIDSTRRHVHAGNTRYD